MYITYLLYFRCWFNLPADVVWTLGLNQESPLLFGLEIFSRWKIYFQHEKNSVMRYEYKQNILIIRCLSYFLHHWYTIIDTHNLKKKRFILTHSWLQGKVAWPWSKATRSRDKRRGREIELSRPYPQWPTFPHQALSPSITFR